MHHRAAVTAALRLMIETAFVTTMLLVVIVITLRLGPGTEVLTIRGRFAYATFRLVPSANRFTMYLSNARAGHAYVTNLYEDFTTQQREAGQDWAGTDTVTRLPFYKEIMLRRGVVRLRRTRHRRRTECHVDGGAW